MNVSGAAPPLLLRRPVDSSPSLVYGPIASRRLGRSLGVNLLPAGLRLCSFDCRYCQCGGRRSRRWGRADPPFPTLGALARDLKAALAKDPTINDICFAGAGEPTLHPRFREAVVLVRELRDRWAPQASVTVLSNGVAAGKPSVRGALALVDHAVLKLDAARDDLLHALDGAPPGLSARRLIEAYATMIGIETQTLLVRGAVDNATPGALAALGVALRFIRPRRAQIGTLTRAPAAMDPHALVFALPRAELLAAVERLRTAAPGVEIVAY